MKPVIITAAHARRLAVQKQLLAKEKLPEGKEGAARIIEHLGYVQIDTINIINRAHHHVLHTRLPGYRQDYLDDLLATDRRIFEYWGHAASYMPLTDYRFYLRAMRNSAKPNSKWEKERRRNFGHLMKPVLERIQAEGPLGVKDFAAPEKGPKNRWGGRKPEKVALEMLLWSGELMVTSRKNFARSYDLTERVLPAHTDISLPGKAEIGRFHLQRALQAFGIASEKEIINHLQLAGKDEIRAAINDRVRAGDLQEVRIAGQEQVYWISSGDLNQVDRSLDKSLVQFLSPFDNLIIQRERTRRIFNFDYTLECYLPASRRKWGYFVLPILWGDQLIGRFDPKADRRQRELIIKKLCFEPDFAEYDTILPILASGLKNLARFNDCDEILLEQAGSDAPANFIADLKAEL